MNQEEKTHWKKLVNPDYLGSYSLIPGKDMVLTIAKIVREKVPGQNGKKEDCSVCYFKEAVKPMVMNRLNQKTITGIYGTPYIEDWPGKQIQLFSALVDAFGEKVEALRIRPFVPKSEKPELKPDTPAFQNALKYMKDGGNIEAIEAKFTIYQPVRDLLNVGNTK